MKFGLNLHECRPYSHLDRKDLSMRNNEQSTDLWNRGYYKRNSYRILFYKNRCACALRNANRTWRGLGYNRQISFSWEETEIPRKGRLEKNCIL